METNKQRPLSEIAQEIRENWKKPYFGAEPYLNAMEDLEKMEEYYGADPADHVVRYFLGNAMYWRGPVAKRIKEELKEMLDANK